MSEATVPTVKVSDLHVGSRGININVKVASKLEERQITSKFDNSTHRVTEAIVGDETGCILLTLWDDNIDQVQPNDKIRIENGYINIFKNTMRLNVGRYGKLTKIDADLADANLSNNLSEKVLERQYGDFGERQGGSFSGGRGRGRRY